MDKFHDDLAEWVKSWCKEESRKRERLLRMRALADEIRWTRNELEKIRAMLPKRPSKIRYFETMRHQLRERELTLTFMEAEHE